MKFLFLLVLFVRLAYAGPLDDLQPGHWYEIPNSKISAALPSPLPPGGTGPASIITAWSGGIVDTLRNRYCVTGGGHGDYAGNEIYCFDLVNLSGWVRIWGPTPNALIPPVTATRTVNCPGWTPTTTEVYYDCTPASRHTYGGLQYLSNIDRFFVHGGSLWSGSGGMGLSTWFYDFNTKLSSPNDTAPWQLRADISACYNQPTPPYSVYEAHGGLVYVHRYNSLCQYNTVADTWMKRGSYGPGISPLGTAVYDPIRKVFYLIGGGVFASYDLSNPANNNIPLVFVPKNGDLAVVNGNYPGVEYDPESDSILGWVGGGDIYKLDLNALVWTRIPPAAGNTVVPGSPSSTGTHGRLRYVPSKKVFVVVSSIYENIYAYKFGGGATSPSQSIPGVPSDLVVQ